MRLSVKVNFDIYYVSQMTYELLKRGRLIGVGFCIYTMFSRCILLDEIISVNKTEINLEIKENYAVL